jgi:methanol--5-hydroxybenzimidazolylcobamide Co-methyltransferase
MGNIAAAMCDLWSNESVQNVRLLSGNAPEVFTEMLAYDCRLMNTAAASGGALTLRQWLVDSDECLSPQAAVLSPQATIEIATAIVGADSHYHASVKAGLAAVDLLRRCVESGTLNLNKKAAGWLSRIESELNSLPGNEAELLAEMEQTHAGVFDPASYGLE